MKKYFLFLIAAHLSCSLSFAETGTHGPITQGLSIPSNWPGEYPSDIAGKLKKVSDQCFSDLGVDLMDIIFRGQTFLGTVSSKNDDVNLNLKGETDRIMSEVVLTSKDDCKLTVHSHACDSGEGQSLDTCEQDSAKIWSPLLVVDVQGCKQLPNDKRLAYLLSVTDQASLTVDPLPTLSWVKEIKYTYDGLGNIIGQDYVIKNVKLDEPDFGQKMKSPYLNFYNYNWLSGSTPKLVFSYPKSKYHQCMETGISDVIGSNRQ